MFGSAPEIVPKLSKLAQSTSESLEFCVRQVFSGAIERIFSSSLNWHHKSDARDGKQSNGCFSYAQQRQQNSVCALKPFRVFFYCCCCISVASFACCCTANRKFFLVDTLVCSLFLSCRICVHVAIIVFVRLLWRWWMLDAVSREWRARCLIKRQHFIR